MNKKIVKYNKDKIYIENDILIEYIKLKRQQEKLEAKLKPLETELKKELIETMEKLGKKDINYNGLNAKLKLGYTKINLDTNSLKENDFDIYSKYLVTTNVKPSITLKLD